MNPFIWIKNQSLFSDRHAVWLLTSSLALTVFNFFYMLARIDRREFKVPVRYSGYFEGSLSDSGDWFTLYAFVIFTLVTFALNVTLALKVHRMRPELAQAVLGLQLVVGVFTFLVARALLDLLD